jgi:hypothetical protein
VRAREILPALVVTGLVGACLLAGPVACSRSAPDATPEGAVRLWLDRMEASSDDPEASREAFDLLGPGARANLEERARRTSQLQGRRVEPFEMLAQGRFGLGFRPKAVRRIVDGDQATVEVLGADPSERSSVRCVHVPAGWRLEPDLPELPTSSPRP